jgi:hypothetical protein
MRSYQTQNKIQIFQERKHLHREEKIAIARKSKRTATMGIHETRQGTRNCKRIQRHCGIPHRYQHLTTSNFARRHLPHDSALRVRDRPRNREQHRFPTPKPKQEPRQEQAGQNHAYLEPLVTIRPPTHGIRRGAAPRVPLPQIRA